LFDNNNILLGVISPWIILF